MSVTAAVDSTTAHMANTSLNDSGNEAPTSEAVIQSAAEGRRLYIGNLAYATTEGELEDFFKEYLIESTSIPVNPRTTKPVGYAFVDVSTPDEAQRAVKDLNGQNILDRKVSVQLARNPAELPAEPTADGEARPRNSGRGRGKARGRGGRSQRGGRTGDADGPTNVPGQVDPLTETTNEALTTDKAVDASDKASKVPRAPRQRGPPEDGVPSKTKIMVANLPYDLREDKLLEIFSAYSPTTAKLALRPIPRFMVRKLQARNEPRKGRGFAFVTLASEELQQKAISEMNGKEIEGRELAVKVAIDSPGKEDEALEAAADAQENGIPATAGDVAPAAAPATTA